MGGGGHGDNFRAHIGHAFRFKVIVIDPFGYDAIVIRDRYLLEVCERQER